MERETKPEHFTEVGIAEFGVQSLRGHNKGTVGFLFSISWLVFVSRQRESIPLLHTRRGDISWF